MLVVYLKELLQLMINIQQEMNKYIVGYCKATQIELHQFTIESLYAGIQSENVVSPTGLFVLRRAFGK